MLLPARPGDTVEALDIFYSMSTEIREPNSIVLLPPLTPACKKATEWLGWFYKMYLLPHPIF